MKFGWRRGTRQHFSLITLLSANAVSQLGSMFTLVALPWFVLQTTGSASKAGITLAVDGVPTFLAGFVGGAIVDRAGYKRSSVATDLMSACAMGAIPLLYLTTGIRFWQLLVFVFFGSLVDQTGRAARSSLIPELAGRGGMPLTRANSLNQATRRAALLFGPPLAGLLVATIGASRVIWVDALSYLVSAVFVGVGVSGATTTIETVAKSVLSETLGGIRYILSDRLLRSIAVVSSAGSLIVEPLYTIVYPVYSREVYHSAAALGFMFSALAVGSLTGLGLYLLIGGRLSNRIVLIGGFIAQAASIWVFVILPSAPLLLGSIAIGAMCSEPINPLVSSLLQQRPPAGMRGRVIGSFSAVAFGTLPVGTMIGGFLLNGLGLIPTLVIIASTSSVLALSTFAIPAFREAPAVAVASA